MRADVPGDFAARNSMVSIFHVCFSSILLGFAARRRLIDKHDVCDVDKVNSLSKINYFASSVFSAKSWSRSAFSWA